MMKSSKFGLLLCISVITSLANQTETGGETFALVHVKKHLFDNDFEEGTVAPWVDLSEGGTHWTIEISSSHSGIKENNALKPPLPPLTGKYFLLVEQDGKTFDMGTLSTTNFIALPGDQIQFSYWISSTWSQFHNLQVTNFGS